MFHPHESPYVFLSYKYWKWIDYKIRWFTYHLWSVSEDLRLLHHLQLSKWHDHPSMKPPAALAAGNAFYSDVTRDQRAWTNLHVWGLKNGWNLMYLWSNFLGCFEQTCEPRNLKESTKTCLVVVLRPEGQRMIIYNIYWSTKRTHQPRLSFQQLIVVPAGKFVKEAMILWL